MDNETEIWKEICFLVLRHSSSNEDKFQIECEKIFERLGWSMYRNEIIPQKVIFIGNHNSLRPDMVITDGKDNIHFFQNSL
jgi:5'(3')-deoxyribonucleotidase